MKKADIIADLESKVLAKAAKRGVKISDSNLHVVVDCLCTFYADGQSERQMTKHIAGFVNIFAH